MNHPFSSLRASFTWVGLLVDYNLQLVLTPNNCLTSSIKAIRFQLTLSSSCKQTNTPTNKTSQGSCNQHIDKMKKSGEPGLL
jgi:hypothetical protein